MPPMAAAPAEPSVQALGATIGAEEIAALDSTRLWRSKQDKEWKLMVVQTRAHRSLLAASQQAAAAAIVHRARGNKAAPARVAISRAGVGGAAAADRGVARKWAWLHDRVLELMPVAKKPGVELRPVVDAVLAWARDRVCRAAAGSDLPGRIVTHGHAVRGARVGGGRPIGAAPT